MRILVAISSCLKNKKRRDWQRATWLPQLQHSHKFFVGGDGCSLEDHTVVLNCKDDYKSLCDKTLGEITWARNHGYDQLFKTDDDVYIRPERLVPPEHDYVGHAYTSGQFKYASGAMIWLSARAMDTIITKWHNYAIADDVNIGMILHREGFKMVDDRRYRIGWKSLPRDAGENEFPHPDNDAVAFHMYWPEYMVEMHNNWTTKQLVDSTHFNSLRNK